MPQTLEIRNFVAPKTAGHNLAAAFRLPNDANRELN
jgi:hypothetical protein